MLVTRLIGHLLITVLFIKVLLPPDDSFSHFHCDITPTGKIASVCIVTVFMLLKQSLYANN